MRRVELTLEVGDAVALGAPQRVAATVYLPRELGAAATVLYAAPGGGYSRRYYDLRVAGNEDYSQAEYHTGHGMIVVAYDYLGAGDSSTSHAATLTPAQVASGIDAAVREIDRRLRHGEVDAGVPPLRKLQRVGIGHSMGGYFSIKAQALHRSFHALAVLGFSAIHTVMPQRGKSAIEMQGAGGRQLPAEVVSRVGDFVYPFFLDDVPDEIVLQDMAGGFPMRSVAPPWGSTTFPFCGAVAVAPGAVSAEAAAIEVPVLVALGERDVCLRPEAERDAYRSSPAVTLGLIPRMAHMHNFASSRHQLWRAIEQWAHGLEDGR